MVCNCHTDSLMDPEVDLIFLRGVAGEDDDRGGMVLFEEFVGVCYAYADIASIKAHYFSIVLTKDNIFIVESANHHRTTNGQQYSRI